MANPNTIPTPMFPIGQSDDPSSTIAPVPANTRVNVPRNSNWQRRISDLLLKAGVRRVSKFDFWAQKTEHVIYLYFGSFCRNDGFRQAFNPKRAAHGNRCRSHKIPAAPILYRSCLPCSFRASGEVFHLRVPECRIWRHSRYRPCLCER